MSTRGINFVDEWLAEHLPEETTDKPIAVSDFAAELMRAAQRDTLHRQGWPGGCHIHRPAPPKPDRHGLRYSRARRLILSPARPLQRLEHAEVARVGRRMAAECGLSFTEANISPCEYVSWPLARAADLATALFAMIDDPEQASNLCPVADKRISQRITGIARDSGA